MKPVGIYRIRIVEFFGILFATNFKSVHEALMKEKVIEDCLVLFFWFRLLLTYVGHVLF